MTRTLLKEGFCKSALFEGDLSLKAVLLKPAGAQGPLGALVSYY